jgi:hypothetical protein
MGDKQASPYETLMSHNKFMLLALVVNFEGKSSPLLTTSAIMLIGAKSSHDIAFYTNCFLKHLT